MHQKRGEARGLANVSSSAEQHAYNDCTLNCLGAMHILLLTFSSHAISLTVRLLIRLVCEGGKPDIKLMPSQRIPNAQSKLTWPVKVNISPGADYGMQQ